MEELSPREREVLDALGERLTNQEIATRLFIGVRTVESHVSALLRKTGAADRRALAALAASGGTATTGPSVSFGPVVADGLLGRDEEVAAVRELLASHRLVTLVGVGGAGKTTLAEAVAGGDAVMVDLTRLAPGADSEAVARVVLESLDLDDMPSRRPLDEVMAHLRRSRRRVIVIDNCEHVIDGAADVVAAMLDGTGVLLLATSRERLAVRGERVHPVGGLAPGAASELFVRRARDAGVSDDLDPALVRRLCESVDGLPLAIELAAARVTVFPLDELVRRVAHSVDLLDGGDRTRRRHRSVRDMLAWSHDLLGESERAAYRRLAVVPGSFRLAVAEHLVAGDPVGSAAMALAHLVDASLLVRDGDGYRQLELVHTDAGERLAASGERPAVEARLLSWARSALDGPLEPRDRAVLRAAAMVAIDRADADGEQFLDRCAQVWSHLGHSGEIGVWFESMARATGDPRRAYAAGDLALSSWHGDEARARYLLAADLAAARGERAFQARCIAAAAEVETRFHSTCSKVDDAVVEARLREARALADGDPAASCLVDAVEAFTSWRSGSVDLVVDQEMVDRLERAVQTAIGLGDPVLISTTLDALASTFLDAGDPEGFQRAHARRADVLEPLSRHHRSTAEVEDILVNWAWAEIAVGRLRFAEELALRSFHHPSQRWLPHASLQALVEVEFLLGNWDSALEHAELAVRTWDDDGRPTASWLVKSVAMAREIARCRGDEESVARWQEWMVAIDAAHPGVTPWTYPELHAASLLLLGRRDEAAPLVESRVAVVRPMYAAVRAEVLGGDAIDEEAASAATSAVPFARWRRARGDLAEAARSFDEMGTTWLAAETRLRLDPSDTAARQVLLDLGIVLP